MLPLLIFFACLRVQRSAGHSWSEVRVLRLLFLTSYREFQRGEESASQVSRGGSWRQGGRGTRVRPGKGGQGESMATGNDIVAASLMLTFILYLVVHVDGSFLNVIVS